MLFASANHGSLTRLLQGFRCDIYTKLKEELEKNSSSLKIPHYIKLKHKGGVLVEIDRFFPSSKLCSNCAHKYQELQLKEREWTCDVCQTRHLRDENAARNIRTEGLRILGLGHNPHGDGVRLRTCSEATVCEVSTTLIA